MLSTKEVGNMEIKYGAIFAAIAALLVFATAQAVTVANVEDSVVTQQTGGTCGSCCGGSCDSSCCSGGTCSKTGTTSTTGGCGCSG